MRLPRGGAMRLVFVGVDGTPDPRLGDDLLGRRFGAAETINNLSEKRAAGRPTPRKQGRPGRAEATQRSRRPPEPDLAPDSRFAKKTARR